MPEELVALKIIMLYQCEYYSSFGDTCRHKISSIRNRTVAALFAFYESKQQHRHAERFGNVLLCISGILVS
jgi:hypothetical protein